MQGIMTIVFGHLSRRHSFRRDHAAPSTMGELALDPVICDAGFEAMLREIDAFSEQLQAEEAQQPDARPVPPAILKRLCLRKAGSSKDMS